MGIADFLFGEGPSSDLTQATTKTPEQQELLKNLIGRLQGGSIQADSTPPELGASLTALENWAAQVYGGGPANVSQEGKAGTAALQDVISRGPSDFSNYFTETVEKPLFETFREDIQPAISRKYAPSGFYSSQRLETDRRANEDLIDALTQARAQTGYQTYQDDLTRILQGGSALATLGGQGQQLATDTLFSRGNEYQRRKEVETNLMLAALGITPFENIMTVSGGQTGVIPSMLSAASQGAGAYFGYGLANKLP